MATSCVLMFVVQYSVAGLALLKPNLQLLAFFKLLCLIYFWHFLTNSIFVSV